MIPPHDDTPRSNLDAMALAAEAYVPQLDRFRAQVAEHTQLGDLGTRAHDVDARFMTIPMEQSLRNTALRQARSSKLDDQLEEFRHELVNTFSYYTWGKAGCPVFVLSHRALASFLLTDVRSLAIDRLKLPFDAFAIELPHPRGFIHVEPGGQRSPVRWVFVHRHQICTHPQFPDLSAMVGERFAAHRGPGSNWMGVGVEYARQVQKLLPELYDHGPECLSMTLWTGKLGESLHSQTPREQSCSIYDWTCFDETLPGSTDYDAMALILCKRLFTNLCLYLSQHYHEIEAAEVERKRQSVRRAQRKQGQRRTSALVQRIHIGRSLSASPELLDVARAYQDGDRSKVWRLLHPRIVQGHWKRQRHGPGRQQVKWIHIEPYHRGRERPLVAESPQDVR